MSNKRVIKKSSIQTAKIWSIIRVELYGLKPLLVFQPGFLPRAPPIGSPQQNTSKIRINYDFILLLLLLILPRRSSLIRLVWNVLLFPHICNLKHLNSTWKQMKWPRKSLHTKMKSEKFRGALSDTRLMGWVCDGRQTTAFQLVPTAPNNGTTGADLPWKHILVMHHFQVASLAWETDFALKASHR